ncbi:MAG: PIN domain-containing protein [Deltaproteobacteria bacterium]|nr:PIN domain-containing protein [Deltaproteobacteria bacterium]
MATVVHLDTHFIVWLWLGDQRRLRPAKKLLETGDLQYSPIVELELQYLHEIGRLKPDAADVLLGLTERMAIARSRVEFGDVAKRASQLSWTRDPFDRLIVASADIVGAPLLTSDETILRHYRRATDGGRA